MAAMLTQKLIDSYQIEAIIFTGIAGSLNKDIEVEDIILAKADRKSHKYLVDEQKISVLNVILSVNAPPSPILIKKQIISELDNLPDKKAYSLLDYLHFLMQNQDKYHPNKKTIAAIEEVAENNDHLQTYGSADELFEDLGINT